ncbi:MAG: septum formation initiator family protein [Candidatus Omnitrophica bacterium]|nr:septum formation initiator family protein [Candidatus Omnitrophota bacterium]MDD5654156.1 septum formation initiator family protein [Candidatus Omnitrophota bacterium]
MVSILSKIIKNALGLFIAAVILAFLFLPGYTKMQDLKEKNKTLDANIHKLKVENTLLKNEIARIQSDPLSQEKIVRDKMGVVRKGEVMYKIEQPPEQAQ